MHPGTTITTVTAPVYRVQWIDYRGRRRSKTYHKQGDATNFAYRLDHAFTLLGIEINQYWTNLLGCVYGQSYPQPRIVDAPGGKEG